MVRDSAPPAPPEILSPQEWADFREGDEKAKHPPGQKKK